MPLTVNVCIVSRAINEQAFCKSSMKKFVNLKIVCVYSVLIVSMKCIALFHPIIHT
jgi:hypothetical protein